MKFAFSLLVLLCSCNIAFAQTAEELIAGLRAKSAKVKDYEAKGKMTTSVSYMKAPVANVVVYFKNPDKLRIKNETGVSFIPKGSVNINMSSLFAQSGEFSIIDAGREEKTGWRIIKLLPLDEKSDIVLSTLYVDEKAVLVRKASTTTKENGSFDLEMTYGKYASYGLADKVVFSFNTKDYRLPKGITFDYDDGTQKKNNQPKDGKGKVEIQYSEYKVNKGVGDEVFEK